MSRLDNKHDYTEVVIHIPRNKLDIDWDSVSEILWIEKAIKEANAILLRNDYDDWVDCEVKSFKHKINMDG
jgi:hypothetical protein